MEREGEAIPQHSQPPADHLVLGKKEQHCSQLFHIIDIVITIDIESTYRVHSEEREGEIIELQV